MNAREFAKRRRHFLEAIGRGGIAVVPSAPLRVRSRDTTHPFRQDSDFFYLTGFPEPEAVAVFVPGRQQGEFLLFCRDRDPDRERWEGLRAGPANAVERYGADDAFPIADIDEILPGLLEQRERVVYAMGAHRDFDQHLIGWLNGLNAKRQSAPAPSEIVVLDPLVHEARLFKSRAEITTMRRSARIAVEAHRRAMRRCRPGLFEYELEAEYVHEFRRHGTEPAYPPIVAGGANACILHYV
ncbi:MAG TPA: aminopeptidase P N-terminal domain-containing protein, partial [Gammaproteobacteria bacterium]|nr:aminopeptidase P N-terminal domain-containing protein [Gammaproteobacteria bacterium]